ncbi:ketopantoate reductase family protein [Marinobacter oulmenensis]
MAILGAGSMGRLWAARLAGRSVVFLPRPGRRPDHPLSYRFQPFQGEAFTVRIPWLAANETPDLLLVTTKAGDTLPALTAALPQLPETTPVVLFQNGLGSQQQVADTWPERPILAATTTEGANRPEPDLTIHAGTGETHVGALTRRGGEALAEVVAQLQGSGLTVHAETDILARLWRKLVINAGINPFTALLDCPNGDLLRQPMFLQWIGPLCRETATLMAAAGQSTPSPESLRQSIEQVARATAGNTSSMRADVLAGRPTEIDYINGYLTALGQQLGIATPVNQMLTEQVKQLDGSLTNGS